MTQRTVWLIAALFSFGLAGVVEAQPVSHTNIRQNLFSTCTGPDGQRWVVGELGRIFNTKDNGQTVVRTSANSREAFLDIACPPSGSLFVTGQHGKIWRSRDDGASWEPVKSGTERTLLAIAFSDENTGMAIGDYGTIVRTEDGGDTWNTVPLPTDIPLPEDIAEIIEPGDVLLYGIDFISETQGWIVGEFGVILTTNDAGATWVAQQSPVETTLFGVSFADAQRGWAVGIEEVLLQTEDGGATWKEQRVPKRKGFVLGIYNVAVKGNFGWAVGDSGFLLRSTNGGRSWERMQLPIELAANWLRGIELSADGQQGLIVGGSGIMMSTTGDQYRKLGK